MSEPAAPFKRGEFVDSAGIVGARWWHEGLVHANPVGRRHALQALLVGGGLLAVGMMVSKSSACGPEHAVATKGALELQKQYGWNFGARGEALTFDGQLTQTFDPTLLTSLATDLAPVRAELRPYFVPTLLQSAVAAPQLFADDPTPFVSLATVLHPIFTPQMEVAYRRGKALAALFDKAVPGVAVVVDLPGPESIAFAAGAATAFDPVFAIDNWPHPRGVVPAHLSLAAAAYYQPLFSKVAATRPATAPAMFVLDRARLSPYTDEGTHFDNRHLAKLPSAAKLSELGVTHLLYVAPSISDVPELDDLNDDFVHDARMAIVVKVVGADAFGPEQADLAVAPYWVTLVPRESLAPTTEGGPTCYYGWNRFTNDAFWVDYPWRDLPPRSGTRPSSVPTAGRDYTPRPRVTPFSSGSPTGAATRAMPLNFGTVPVLVATATGAVIAQTVFNPNGTAPGGGGSGCSGSNTSYRSGSWTRSTGGWGG